MTTKPELRLGPALIPGIVAVALFAVMALIVLNVPFESASGFPDGATITAEVGYALLDLTALQSTEGALGDTEPFLVAFLLAAVVLDAALDASLVLAKREEAGETVTALRATRDADETVAAADGGARSGADEENGGDWR